MTNNEHPGAIEGNRIAWVGPMDEAPAAARHPQVEMIDARRSIVTDLDNIEADVAILGIPFSDPYTMDEARNDSANNRGLEPGGCGSIGNRGHQIGFDRCPNYSSESTDR